MTAYDMSKHVIGRMRAFRKVRRITGDQFARGLTLNGYPMTRPNYSAIENGRTKVVPIDLAVAASRYLKVSLDQLLDGPLCKTCHDDPPVQFICRMCLRTKNAAGVLIDAKEDTR